MRGKDSEAVLFSDGFQLVEGKVGEGFVEQPLPKLIHDEKHPAAVNHFFQAVQQVESNRRADAAVIEKFRAVDAEVGMRVEVERVHFIVKDPGELPARDPLLEALGYRARNLLSRSPFGHVFKEHSEKAVFLPHGHDGGDRSRDLLFVFGRDGQPIHREDEMDESIQELNVGERRV